MNALFGIPAPAHRGRNTYVLEYVDKPRFWILGTFIVVFFVFSLRFSDVKDVRGRRGQRHGPSGPGGDTASPPHSSGPEEQHPSLEAKGPWNEAPADTDDEDDALPATTTRSTDTTTPPASPDLPSTAGGPPVFTAWLDPRRRATRALAALLYLSVLYLLLLEGYWLTVTMWRWTGAVVTPLPTIFLAWVAWVLAGGFMLCVDGVLVGLGLLLVMFPVICLLELRFSGTGGEREREAAESKSSAPP